MKLYEIAADYENLLNAIEAGEIPEEAIADTLESVVSLLEDKADNIACAIKNLLAEAKAIKAEEDNLAERRKQKEKTAKSMKAYLGEVLLRSGYTKLETARNKLSFRKSEKVHIEDEEKFISWALVERDDLLTYAEPKISLTEIKKALANGEETFGATIESNQNLQIK